MAGCLRIYNIYASAGARTEMPGCSLCMGNQARIAAGSTAVSTSTRNFPNRLGKGANVFLSSAELASVAAILTMAPEIYKYLNSGWYFFSKWKLVPEIQYVATCLIYLRSVFTTVFTLFIGEISRLDSGISLPIKFTTCTCSS